MRPLLLRYHLDPTVLLGLVPVRSHGLLLVKCLELHVLEMRRPRWHDLRRHIWHVEDHGEVTLRMRLEILRAWGLSWFPLEWRVDRRVLGQVVPIELECLPDFWRNWLGWRHLFNLVSHIID